MTKRILIEKEEVYGYLRIIKEVAPKGRRRYFKCQCTYEGCGTKKDIRLSHLMSGSIVSCGCYNKQLVLKSNTKHGFRSHPLYAVWTNMVKRCGNKKHPQYSDYGGRGIKVCSDWIIPNHKGLKNFIDWNASLPIDKQWNKRLELDRHNNNKGYNPDNCRWISKLNNINNRRNTIMILYKDKSMPLSEIVKNYGKYSLTYNAAYYRYTKGWHIDDILARIKADRL